MQDVNRERQAGGLVFYRLAFCRAFVIGLLLCSSTIFADEIVLRDIIFKGLHKTKPALLLREMPIKAGQPVTLEMLKKSKQSIMNLELFRSVSAELIPTQDAEQVDAVLSVVEKRYVLVVPTFSHSSDGDNSFGIRLMHDNLFGLNHSIKLKAVTKQLKDTDIQNQQNISLKYNYPRVRNSAYSLQLTLGTLDADIDEQRDERSGRYNRNLNKVGVSISRWLDDASIRKGWRINGGFRLKDYNHDFISGDPGLFDNVLISSAILGIENTYVDHFQFSRNGSEYGYRLEIANQIIGSDLNIDTHHLFYRRYIALGPRPGSNLNFQLRAGWTSQSIFGDATFPIVGGSLVRGFRRDSIEGDAFYIGNLAYLRPLWGRNNVRGALLLDIGNANESVSDLDFSDTSISTGFGLRWKIQSFVRTDLRMDVARGLTEDGETKFYFGTRLAF